MTVDIAELQDPDLVEPRLSGGRWFLFCVLLQAESIRPVWDIHAPREGKGRKIFALGSQNVPKCLRDLSSHGTWNLETGFGRCCIAISSRPRRFCNCQLSKKCHLASELKVNYYIINTFFCKRSLCCGFSSRTPFVSNTCATLRTMFLRATPGSYQNKAKSKQAPG